MFFIPLCACFSYLFVYVYVFVLGPIPSPSNLIAIHILPSHPSHFNTPLPLQKNMGRPKRLSTPELMRLGPGFSPSLSEGSSDESVKLAAETRNRLLETRTTEKKLRNNCAIPNHNLNP